MGNTVLMYAEEALAQCQQIGLFDENFWFDRGKNEQPISRPGRVTSIIDRLLYIGI